MSQLRGELARAGIRGRYAARIVAELEDHLATDPNAHVGAPREIAERFASELRIARTRRAMLVTFVALAVCGALFMLVVATHRGSTSPGWTAPVSALAALAAAQIAFVAGMLALVRVLRARTAGDLRVAQRRGFVALAAGAIVAVALAGTGALYALLALPGLALAARASRSALAITPDESADGLRVDLPFPRVTLTLLGAAAAGIVFLQGVVGEKSLQEGLIRGGIEVTGLVLGMLLLGRVLALSGPSRAR
jgi:hypothetical protein